jgi:membrane-associated phospholipid phosphatase
MKGNNVFILSASILLSLGVVASIITEKGSFLLWLSGKRTIFLDYFFYYATRLGEAWAFVAVGLILWRQSWKKMVFIPALGLLTTLLTWVLKKSFGHERPSHYLERIAWEGPREVLDYNLLIGHSSFPSGHSMAAWSLFALFAFMMNNKWISLVSLVLASLVSLSRIYLMAHFLQDVVTGAVVGVMLGLGLYRLYLYWLTHSEPGRV